MNFVHIYINDIPIIEAKYKKGNVSIALPTPPSKTTEALDASTSAVNWAIGCNFIAMLIKFGAFSMTGKLY